MKKIAILGAGLSGIATCWHLLQGEKIEITLFDPNGIAGGASGVAPGLLHTFCGPKAKKPWKADIGFQATCDLLKISSLHLESDVADFSGIFRPAVSEKQLENFKKSHEKYEKLEWWSDKTSSEKISAISPLSGLFIKDGIVVNCRKYLKGLWLACENLGARLNKRTILSLDELEEFDSVVIAMGAATKKIKELHSVPFTPIKGQLLELSWPKNLPPLPVALNSKAYIVMSSNKQSCIVGSTFERDFIDESPELVEHLQIIRENAEALYPPLKEMKVIGHFAGIRASASKNQNRPLVGRMNKRCWLITGMGSKGLLYHAWLGNLLSKAILADNDECIPQECKRIVPKL
ncbi:MAG: glycine/D-amino acid oxidase-like deaminating enzyme [Chlamydiales bacterium]|jgi:glycine/D-amino acid oxidase-like deaminating enzyme